MAKFNYGTFLTLVLDRIQQKSVFAATVNNTSDVSILGRVGDGIRVQVDPLTKITAKTLSTADFAKLQNADVANPSFSFDRLVSNYTTLPLNTWIYAAFEANGLDTLDFADEAASNYDEYVIVCADRIAANIDTAIINGVVGAATNTAISIPAGTRDEVALGVLDGVQTLIDNLDQAGVPGPYVVAINPATGRRVSPLLEKYTFTGDSNNVALRQNIIGELYGAPTIKSSKVPANTAVVYAKDAAVVASRPTGTSSGAKVSKTVRSSDGSLALTANLGFDPNTQTDKVAVSTLANVGVLDATRAQKVTFTFA